jgi:hypothetical protein
MILLSTHLEIVKRADDARAMQVTYFEKVVDDLRHEYAALLEKFTALRLAGAVDAPPVPPVREAAKPDPVLTAIIAKAGKSIPLRNHYISWVSQQRAASIPEEAIAKQIMQGQSDDSEGVM